MFSPSEARQVCLESHLTRHLRSHISFWLAVSMWRGGLKGRDSVITLTQLVRIQLPLQRWASTCLELRLRSSPLEARWLRSAACFAHIISRFRAPAIWASTYHWALLFIGRLGV